MRYSLLLALLLRPSTGAAFQDVPKTWQVSPRPVVSIGTRDTEGPYLFASIPGAVRLSTGAIVVADGGSLQLRLYSATGQHVKTAGGKGSGPGEFRLLSPIHRCAGDSVFVYDPAQFRISVFSPNLDFVRTADLRKWSPSGYPPYNFWCHPSGTLAFLHRGDEPAPAEGPVRHTVEISLVGPRDAVVRLGMFPASEMYFKIPAAGPRHLGRKTTVAVGASTVYVGTADTYEVLRFSPEGVRTGTLRESRAPTRVTPEQVAVYVDDWVARHPKRNEATTRRNFSQLRWPELYPAYGRLIVDQSDNLWIEEFPIPGKKITRWSVYSSSGRKLAWIDLPKDFRILEAGSDYVMGVWRDELDVDYLRVHAIMK